MESGGEWKHGVRKDFCSERNVRLQFQGKGVHPWTLERRKLLARGIFNRLHEGGRFVDRAILNEVR